MDRDLGRTLVGRLEVKFNFCQKESNLTENQAVAAIGPVFALVKVGVVVGHHVNELRVAFFFTRCLSGNSVSGNCGNDDG